MKKLKLLFRLTVSGLFFVIIQGCMLSPHEGENFASRYSQIPIFGYVDKPNVPVKVYAVAWNSETNCSSDPNHAKYPSHWEHIGTAISNSQPDYDSFNQARYSWDLQTVVDEKHWCLTIGANANPIWWTRIYSKYRYYASQNGTKWRKLRTVEWDWPECVADTDGSNYEAYQYCTRNQEDYYTRITATYDYLSQ